MKNGRFVLMMATFLLAGLGVVGQESNEGASREKLVVEVARFSPMVMKEGDTYLGFDIELWRAIAKELNRDTEFKEVPFKEIIPDIEAGKADLALAGITINAVREERIDFSHPYFDSGLSILAPIGTGSTVSSLANALLDRAMVRTMVLFVAFIMFCGHVLWYAERGKDAINDKYFPGIFEAFWCVLTTMTTVGYGDIAPTKWLGRLAAAVIMLTGIGFFGIVVAQLAAGLTLQQLDSDIQGMADLRGKYVATVQGTIAEEYLAAEGVRVLRTEEEGAMYNALMQGKVEAVVYDSPSVMHFAKNNAEEVIVAGQPFANQCYGIAFPPESPLREEVNRALLKLKESGVYDAIYEKWFGGE